MSMGKMDPERVIKVSTSSVNAVITMARDGAVSVYGCKRVERVKEGGHLKLAFRSSTIETRKDSGARWWWSRRKKKTVESQTRMCAHVTLGSLLSLEIDMLGYEGRGQPRRPELRVGDSAVDMDLESVLISEGLVCSCPAAKAYRGSVRRQRWLGTEASEMRVSLSTKAESLNAQVDFDNLCSYFAFFFNYCVCGLLSA